MKTKIWRRILKSIQAILDSVVFYAYTSFIIQLEGKGVSSFDKNKNMVLTVFHVI